MKVNQSTQEKLREINKAGSVAAKTKITMDAVEKNARESNAKMKTPSKYIQQMASAFNKLNIF
ncbi:hypothetical protein [Halobacteriovorax sp.]|uniref:hypothetical protein n=1 Tax=Halobacteriovorax sp. TaxID=2020862 RepID=UPI003561CE17